MTCLCQHEEQQILNCGCSCHQEDVHDDFCHKCLSRHRTPDC